jgi:hypothetical protein
MGLRPTQRDEDAAVWGRLATGGRLSIGPLANSWRTATASSRSVCREDGNLLAVNRKRSFLDGVRGPRLKFRLFPASGRALCDCLTRLLGHNGEMGSTVERVLRLRICASPACRASFTICVSCDRGQRYCSPSCREADAGTNSRSEKTGGRNWRNNHQATANVLLILSSGDSNRRRSEASNSSGGFVTSMVARTRSEPPDLNCHRICSPESLGIPR